MSIWFDGDTQTLDPLRIRFERQGRRPQTYPDGRRCHECNTLLSRYNRGPTCFAHRSFQTPRLRGVVRPEWADDRIT